MTFQDALTIVMPVVPERVAGLEAALDTMRADPAHNDLLPFGAIEGCHFGRLVLLPAAQDLAGRALDPQLLLITDCDGSAHRHLRTLVEVCGDGLDRIFYHCQDYPEAPATHEARLGFLRRHVVRAPANYVHRPGRTVQQIRREAELREAVQDFLDGQHCDDLSALEVRQRVQAYLRERPQWHWALQPAEGLPWPHRAREALDMIGRPLGLVAIGPFVVPTVVAMLVLVRMQELRDRPAHVRPSPEHVRRLVALEDHYAHNGFTAGGHVKPGLVRQAVVASVLGLIGYGTRHLFTRDSLAGVKSIHFARWIPIDGGRRVVFASNFDGSMEAYNNDFIDLIAWGLNLIFGNGLGYPPTRWLIFGGATYEQQFKDYLRCHQVPTPVWYSAYPQLTARNVERNAQLRAGLSGRMNEQEAQQWLRLL